MTYRLLVPLAVVFLAACTRAPLTDPKIVLSGATRGDIPRDANGEPILDRVKPTPPNAILPPPAPPPAPN
jgi:hypothetical protein